MKIDSKDRKLLKKLDALGKCDEESSYSPNDVLVQISLPLILILAIATRLMMIGQSVASYDNKTEMIMDLWKQQFIMSIDKVLEDWEKSSGILSFPVFDRVRWSSRWPDDENFRTLCTNGQSLADVKKMTIDLYLKVLVTGSDAERGSGASWMFYDPEVQKDVVKPAGLPSECIITADRRKYAVQYIEQRCLKWKAHLEDLQWRTVEHTVRLLPPGDSIADRDIVVQMEKLAGALTEKGYPLLPSVGQEYKHDGRK